MQTLPAKDYAAMTNPGNMISFSPGDGCIGMDKTGLLTGFRVGVRSAVIPFFQSLSPCYQQSPAINDKSVPYDAGSAAQTGQLTLKDICQGAGFVAQLAGAWVPEVKLLADVVAKLSTYGNFGGKVIEYLQEQNAINGELSVPKSTGEQHRSCAQNNVPQAALVASTIVALAQIPIAAAAPDSSNAPIPVPDRETLAQIGINGKSGKYPSDGHYIQTKDINSDDVSIGSEEKPFEGRYDGGCHTISGQRRCLFGKLAEHGVVSNLRMAQAHVESDDKYSAVVACKMGEGSRVENLLIEHSSLLTNKDRIPSPTLSTDPKTHAGLVTGHQGKKSHIGQIGINNCSITSTGQDASIGIISGVSEGHIRQVTVNNSRAQAKLHGSIASIGTGVVKGQIDQLTVLNSQAETDEFNSIAGIGAGEISGGGRVKHLTTFNSSVETGKENSDAGIGAGRCFGLLEKATAIACNATALGEGSNVGIGVGRNDGEAFDIKAIYCIVNATGHNANAAIGTGYFQEGRTEDITVVNSSITASGKGSRADIGAGKINSFLSDINHHSIKSMTDSVRGANVTVNGILQNILNVPQATLDQLCDIADQRFIAKDCQVIGQFSKDDWNCTSTVSPTVPSSAGAAEIKSVPASLVNLTASATALLNNTATPAVSLVTGAESGAALSTGAIAGISAGVVGVLGLGALFAWRYYVHRTDPDTMTMRVLKSHRKHSRFQMGKMSDFD